MHQKDIPLFRPNAALTSVAPDRAVGNPLRADGEPRVSGLCAGTVGTDGPTDAAGGFALPNSLQRARNAGFSRAAHLDNNDFYPLLKASGDLLVAGSTRTNVMDLAAILVN
ncbi:MOFRL family protein [Pseudodesulfovibrio tunisiensis]|uniref:MOFRL family protein n=1 Tax=Pseudodesulfovibrio tunisiensis TaxID=463192 RepID=UPI001FB20118|nr:MOFRL family protein [Pseudodesulfovibrio tunisiensis]